MKSELVAVAQAAINEYLRSMRGANAFGANATVTNPNAGTLLIGAKTPEYGLIYFEVIVKETW